MLEKLYARQDSFQAKVSEYAVVVNNDREKDMALNYNNWKYWQTRVNRKKYERGINANVSRYVSTTMHVYL